MTTCEKWHVLCRWRGGHAGAQGDEPDEEEEEEEEISAHKSESLSGDDADSGSLLDLTLRLAREPSEGLCNVIMSLTAQSLPELSEQAL